MTSTSQQDNNCVSIRSRIRKSQRVIDPQFDNVQEILLSFVNSKTTNNGDTNNNSIKKGKGGEKKGEPAILLTPIPNSIPISNRLNSSNSRSINKTTRQRSLNNPALLNLNNSSVEVKRKQSIISDIGSGNGDADGGGGLNNSGIDSSIESEGEFIGLEKLEMGNVERVIDDSDSFNKSHHSNNAQPMQLNISRLKPPQSNNNNGDRSSSKLPPTGNNNSRYSSPLNVIRTSSGVSVGGGGGEGSLISNGTNSDHLSSSVRSRSSRSRSRSRNRRSRQGVGRMRSYGASSAFANASNNNGMNGSLNGEESDIIGDCSDNEKQEPITIPLKDILSVDEEVPSRNKGGSSSANGSGGSDFYSSAASDVGIAKELKRDTSMRSTPRASNSTPSFSQLRKDWDQGKNSNATKNSSTGQNKKIPHRIFLHTLSHGYIEFSLENENSHDIFMAYLKAHLSSDRIPQRNGSIVDGSNAGSSSLAVKHRTASAGGGLLRTMVLTPTKEVPGIDSRSTSMSSTTKSQLNLPDRDTYDGHAPPPSSPKRRNSKHHRPQLVSRDSSSVSVASNKIDKLHSKIINQRIKNESTTFSRVKESFEGWMSSIVDCACCQDTTVAPDPSTVGSIRSNKGIVEGTPDSSRMMKNNKQRSPTSERLRNKGIGGLSFEVESHGPPGSPKLSFEQSMG